MQINAFLLDIAVNEHAEPLNDTPRQLADISRTPGLVKVLAAVLTIETLALVGTTIFLVFELLVAPADSVASAVALTVVVAIAAIWLGFIVVNTLRGNAWTRGATIVVQVLFAAVAIGSFQGLVPRLDIGWLLLIPVIVVLVLMFTKPVLAHTDHRE